MSAAMAAGGTGAVVRQGHLRKLKTMKKKYFVLRAETADCSARLEYYESEKKFKAGVAPRRELPLKSCYNIMRRLDLKQKHVIALFTREEQFCVVADNEQDLHAWLTAILKQHRTEDASEELLHPIQHVWQVNVQKRGLGATKNIQGLYNLCLTDKTLTLVKIKSHNNVIRDLGIPERVEYSLKNIRRCGDSECFFYMEVGRQTVTGSGEIWMHSDDSNIAQSMHSTIYHAMRNCAKESENDRDHIVIPSRSSEGTTLPARRQTYSDGRGRAGLCNDKGLCVGSCIKQCVCSTATHSIDDSAAAIAPLTLKNAENQPPNNTLTDPQRENPGWVIKHHRTVSLPTGCPLFQEPLKIVHERTRSAPLTGDEVDRVTIEKAARYSSCKAVNGTDAIIKKCQWSRRASTGARLSKLSPAHTKNTTTFRNRCDSMPSRASSSLDAERPPPRHTELIEGLSASHDETDGPGDWHCTPRIPEEPDYCEMSPRDLMNTSIRSGSVQHSRTSSLAVEEPSPEGLAVPSVPDGYLPMAPAHDVLGGGLVSASSGSVCSGTPSTDPRFSEYQLEPATSHIIDEDERPPRAYSVGSRPAVRPTESSRHRAYSVGARHRPPPPSAPPAPRSHTRTSSSAPLLPRASAEDLMELDFSNNSPAAKLIVARTPPAAGFTHPIEAPRPKVNLDEYVDMSPRNAGYVEMKPGEGITPIKPETSDTSPSIKTIPLSRSPPSTVATTPDGYVEMNYSRVNRVPTRPIAITRPITAPVPIPPLSASPHTPAEETRRARELRESRTPLGSQTIFPLSLDSPASPRPDDRDELDPTEVFDDELTHHSTCLSTVREISEECGRRSPELSSSPQYVALSRNASRPITTPNKTPEEESQELSCNPTATKTLVRVPDADAVVRNASRFSAGGLNYAALDLEPRLAAAAPAPRTYTQIDFARSEKLHAADGN